MDDASLDRGIREDGRDRLGEALQAVDDHKEDILDAAGAAACVRWRALLAGVDLLPCAKTQTNPARSV
jgi:hypothetical protein